MGTIGHLHPLIVHFPIALVVIAAAAESAVAATGDQRWRAAALVNIRAGAAFAVPAAVAGWWLVPALGLGPTPTVAYHRWLGTAAACATVAAALATWRADRWSRRDVWTFRLAVTVACACVVVTGHLGALLVWGSDFLP